MATRPQTVGPSNKRLKLTGALVLKEPVVSCPGEHLTRPPSLRRRASRPQLKRGPLGNGRMCPRTLRTLVTQFARAITLALATILGGSTSMPAQLGPSETLRTALAALARRDWRSLAALIDPRA